jgi:hypothetical protein
VRRNSQIPRITDAARSRNEELHSREVRYVLMMLIRAACLIVATVLVSVHAPYLAIWIPILLFIVVVVPWLAVILANDRGPKEKYRLSHRQHPVVEPLSLSAPREPGDGPLTIDIDPETGFATYRDPADREAMDGDAVDREAASHYDATRDQPAKD